MSKKTEGFALKNPHFNPDAKPIRNVIEPVYAVSREIVSIVSQKAIGAALRLKQLEKTVYSNGVEKSRVLGSPKTVSTKTHKIGVSIEAVKV